MLIFNFLAEIFKHVFLLDTVFTNPVDISSSVLEIS